MMNIRIAIVILLIVLLPARVFAARLVFDGQNRVAANGTVSVDVMIDTEHIPINAVEGEVSYDAALFQVSEIRDGGSVINFWIQKPAADKGTISFAGITPGGITSGEQRLFTIVLRATAVGNDTLSFSAVHLLHDDGTGSEVPVHLQSHPIAVTNAEARSEPAVVDTVQPEDFMPSIAQHPDLFDGDYAVVFATVDKDSGIDHYEIREGLLGAYVDAESPHLLKHQTLTKPIYVKAVDNAGNERVAMIPAQHATPWYEQYILFAILCAALGVLMLAKKKLWHRFEH
jgi:hypothetical protein